MSRFPSTTTCRLRTSGRRARRSSDPNLLYDTRHALDEFGVLNAEEATTFARLLLAERMDHGRLHAALGPAIDRFAGLVDDEKDRFRDALGRFVRIYGFLSQIVTFADTLLERDYLFAKALQAFVKGRRRRRRRRQRGGGADPSAP